MPVQSLSIVIPAFNEARRIGRSLAAIAEWASAEQRSVELIIADDGSSDDTLAIVNAFNPPQHVRLTVAASKLNRGKGAALRTGVAASSGDRVLLCDADLSTPIDELAKLEAAINAGADVAIASRDMPDSRLDPPQPLARRVLAWGFRTLRRQLFLAAIRDTQCGFKLWRGDLARPVFADCRCEAWLIDCESLAIAAGRGAKVAEIGVTWRNDRDSRVRVLHTLPATLRELWRIRRIGRQPAASR